MATTTRESDDVPLSPCDRCALYTGSLSQTRTRLGTAVWNGHTQCLIALIASGTEDINERFNHGGCVFTTALLLLSGMMAASCTQWLALVDAGAEINACDISGMTVLMHVARNRALSSVVARVIATPGVNLNARDSNGNTALHHASVSYGEHAVKMLIEAGARVDVTNDDGETPLSFARSRVSAASFYAQISHAVITSYLVNAGASPHTYPVKFPVSNYCLDPLYHMEPCSPSVYAVLVHAHRAHAAYTCALVLSANLVMVNKRGRENNVSSSPPLPLHMARVISNHHLLATIVAPAMFPTRALWRDQLPSLLAIQGLARLAATVNAHRSAGSRCLGDIFSEKMRKNVMRIVNEADAIVLTRAHAAHCCTDISVSRFECTRLRSLCGPKRCALFTDICLSVCTYTRSVPA